MSGTEYTKINDTEISVQNTFKMRYSWFEKAVIYDFANQIMLIVINYDKSPATNMTHFSELDSLDGVKTAYHKLKDLGGNPPEMDFPDDPRSKKAAPLRAQTTGFPRK